jgi:hypothetical protein
MSLVEIGKLRWVTPFVEHLHQSGFNQVFAQNSEQSFNFSERENLPYRSLFKMERSPMAMGELSSFDG